MTLRQRLQKVRQFIVHRRTPDADIRALFEPAVLCVRCRASDALPGRRLCASCAYDPFRDEHD